jgi:hypothetical protein
VPWITLTVADVKTRLAGAEVNALQTAALATGQADPTADIIDKVVKELRGRLRNKADLEVGETIPDNWAHHCLAVIRFRLYTRLPMAQFLTQPRITEYDDAMKAFIQLGPILPDEPVNVDLTLVDGGIMPLWNDRVLSFTRDQQDGL